MTSWKVASLACLASLFAVASDAAADKAPAAGIGTVRITPPPGIVKPGGPPHVVPPVPTGLTGWVDLHAHPMTNLAFGGKLIHGGVDVGSLLPSDANCNHNVRATSIDHALGSDYPTHGGWDAFNNPCGDNLRKEVIDGVEDGNHAAHPGARAMGSPSFQEWPVWNDITHQKMWVDWIRQAKDGGLRVMVALATNNKTLGDAVAGPGDYPTDDKSTGDRQLLEMKAFIGRHADFMEIAYTSADLHRIVSSNRLAVVMGVELDNFGNFNTAAVNDATISAELDRLYGMGVRYIFPVHVIDNAFGGTAVYEGGFNTSNFREGGHFWDLQCSAPGDGITFRYVPEGFDLLLAAGKLIKLGLNPAVKPPPPPVCPAGTGHQNQRGMSAWGQVAMKAMMKRGMIVDIDHMSQKTANQALDIASAVPNGGYPVTSGHAGVRGIRNQNNENSKTPAQLQRIAALKGMFGLGTASALANEWLEDYGRATQIMGTPGSVVFGTDLNGLVAGPRPRPGAHVYDAQNRPARTGAREWNYEKDGVAHYGMMADFVRDLRTLPNGNALVDGQLFRGAEAFFQMWQRCETQKGNVR